MEHIIREAAKAGIQLKVRGDALHITAPEGALTEGLKYRLKQNKAKIIQLLQSRTEVEAYPTLSLDTENRYKPFPLTDLQHAYWLGREASLEMGDVATHLYVELDCRDIDINRLNGALCRMIDRHDMLRAIVGRNGMQRILPEVPPYVIAVDDQTLSSPQEAERAVAKARSELSHEVRVPDQWPLFEVRATALPDAKVQLHVSLDLLILDALSIYLFFREWHKMYANPEYEPTPLTVSFRDYVIAERQLHETNAYRQAHTYWTDRLDSLPAAPDLPLRNEVSTDTPSRFSRREFHLPKSQWSALKMTARDHGLTASGLLLTAYSEVLARWSTSPHFTLNMTVSTRLPMHKQINQVIGDFINLLLLEVDRRDHQLTFLEFARSLQRQLARDLDHSQESGVSVMREWAKRRGTHLQATMPVVFSSGLVLGGDEEVGDLEQFGRKVFSVSQTSQVWLDQHVVEIKGDLVLVWDAADAVFEEGVLDAMFETYCAVIKQLANDQSAWDQRNIAHLPDAMWARRLAMNPGSAAHAELPSPDKSSGKHKLHADFVRKALDCPNRAAVISDARSLTYGELLAESCAVAESLIESGLSAGQPVGIIMRKGWEQIVAVYGVLLADAFYMPIDADLPVKRQQELLSIGKVGQVVTQPGVLREDLLSNATDAPAVIEVHAGRGSAFSSRFARTLDGNPDELAYVIFTSGTTGVPKGVMIDHQGAANTIKHINELFAVSDTDRVLAVSSLSFDLSVYDIFGLLDVGGAIVIPDYHKGHDPIHWRELIVQSEVTLWNSAPQLMQMLIDSFQSGERINSILRTVLLSGDWIPLDLPDRIHHRFKGTDIVSLGGATEASIWSIYYPIQSIKQGWRSIPYGKPLPKQTVWVYDQAFRPCPDGVVGRIFIGGAGLAKGYWLDEEKTSARFIFHPETNERLYDTGDLGRYMPDGQIEMLGRDDRQVKIRGHRVEIGEIETVLSQGPKVSRCYIHPVDRDAASSSGIVAKQNIELAAYIEFEKQESLAGSSENQLEVIKDYLSEHLPEYMLPQHFVAVDTMPLSNNGKLDYKALAGLLTDTYSNEREIVHPRNDVEQRILDAWTNIIVDFEIGVTDNFFELGGDSVLATQLIREINDALSFNLEMHELFENLTIESLAELYQKKNPIESTPAKQETAEFETQTTAPSEAMETKSLASDIRYVKEDIQTASGHFKTLGLDVLANHYTGEPKAIFITGATGWIGTHLLAELLSSTDATLYCLLREKNSKSSKNGNSGAHIIENIERCGYKTESDWSARVIPIIGDLSLPHLGIAQSDWQLLSEKIDTIYHFGASTNVMVDYAEARKTNVTPTISIVELAAQHHKKAVFYISPMTICRRQTNGGLHVLSEERIHPDAEGLVSGYALSKWAVEQLLLGASECGLPVKIYRTSRALPNSLSGMAKERDTYSTVLKAASRTGVLPDLDQAVINGVPVDTLSRLIVRDSITHGASGLVENWSHIVHIENKNPVSLRSILKTMIRENDDDSDIPVVSINEWKERCRHSLIDETDEEVGLARLLFNTTQGGSPVDKMFSEHVYDTSYFINHGCESSLTDLTPTDYWRKVTRHSAFNNTLIATH